MSTLAITIEDHIVYIQSGLNPRRPNMKMSSFVKNGTTSKFDWLGTMPLQDRLYVVNPKSGYFVTANNRPASELFQGGYFNEHIFTARNTRLEQLIKGEI